MPELTPETKEQIGEELTGPKVGWERDLDAVSYSIIRSICKCSELEAKGILEQLESTRIERVSESGGAPRVDTRLDDYGWKWAKRDRPK